MTTRTFVTLAILAALCLNIVSAQVSCTCDWLQTSLNTINALYDFIGNASPPFEISSINLNTYYISSYVNSACGNIGAFAQVEASSSSEARKVSRKGKKFTLTADEPSFLELTQTIAPTDVTNALVFDALCISQFGRDPNVFGADQSYCSNPLRSYFSGSFFPSTKGKDNQLDLQTYVNQAYYWYLDTVYNELGCTF